MIIRARRKPIGEIPAKYLCCDHSRRAFELPPDDCFVETTLIRTRSAQCAFCGDIKTMPGAQIVGEPIRCEIFLECYDLDEGETTPAEFLNA